MSKSCIAQFNSAASRWEAIYNGRILASSTDVTGGPDYLRKVIEGGFSKKARNCGVTSVQFVGEVASASAPGVLVESIPIATIESEFGINERFDILSDYVDMVAKGQLPSCLATGEGGLGKTFTVMESLTASGLKDIATLEIGARFGSKAGYVVVKGYSTPKGLFRTLYENRNQIIVFDDCDSVLRDPTAVNLLKAALDSYDTRTVSWNAETSFGGEDDMPKTFEFKGGVIFISNMPKSKIPQAIRSRAMIADVSMTRAEIIERMQMISKSPKFMPDFDDTHKLDALEFVAAHAHHPLITELNLRSLVSVVKARQNKPDNWKRMALYSMANS